MPNQVDLDKIRELTKQLDGLVAKKGGTNAPQNEAVSEKTPKLKPIALPKLEPPSVSAFTPKLLPEKFKPFYLKDDADINEAVAEKFNDAIGLFAASGKDAISDNMIPAANFSDRLQKGLTAAKGQKAVSAELVELLKKELQPIKIIPREPRQEPFKAEEPTKQEQPPKKKTARKKKGRSKEKEKLGKKR